MKQGQFMSVVASVLCETEEHAATAAEVLSRALVGLALEGRTTSMNILTVDEDD